MTWLEKFLLKLFEKINEILRPKVFEYKVFYYIALKSF